MREQRPSVSGIYLLSCPCGENVAVNIRNAARSAVCPRCKKRLEFTVSLDPRTRKSRVALVLSAASFAPPPEEKPRSPKTRVPRPRPSAAPPAPAPARGTVTAPCSCGATIDVTGEQLACERTCARCNTSFHVVIKIDRHTGAREAILIPKDPLGAHKPKSAATMPPHRVGPKSTRRTARLTGAKINSDPLPPLEHARMKTLWGPAPSSPSPAAPADPPAEFSEAEPAPAPPKPPAPKRPPPAPAEPPPGTQRADCPCGQWFFIRRKDLGSERPCPTCGKNLTFEEGRDPQTLAPTVRVRLLE